MVGERGAHIEAVSLWVQVDPVSGRPAPLGDDFDRIYGPSAAGRTVSSKLSLPAPPDDAERRPWQVRRADLDVFGHVNNAVLWAVLEDVVDDAHGRRGTAEIEYAGPVDAGAVVEARVLLGEQPTAWLVEDGTLRCAMRWTPDNV